MKLTGELKDKVDKTESMVEKKDIIAEAGMELTDAELEGVVGGCSDEETFYIQKENYEWLLSEKEKAEKSGDTVKLKEFEKRIENF